MTTLREAAQQALEALEMLGYPIAAIAALRAALAQQEEGGGNLPPPLQAEPVQEPVAWSFEARHIDTAWGSAVSLKHPGREHKYMRNVKPLYLAPPQRKPLTEEEIYEMYSEPSSDAEMVEFARAIERAHGIGGYDEQV